jgi:histidine ammonia-lyase
MTLQLNSRADFTIENYAKAAWGGAPVAFSAAALQRMADCRTAFMRLIDSDPDVTIYGVTSGYGQFARVRLKPDERRAHAKKPPYGSHAAFGPPLPERVARGIVFARLANYVEGHGAVTPALAQAVAQMLDGRPLPPVSAMGQGGAGEILGLGPLFSALAFRAGVRGAVGRSARDGGTAFLPHAAGERQCRAAALPGPGQLSHPAARARAVSACAGAGPRDRRAVAESGHR